MNYFLAKTDPETYSIESLKQEKETVWDGVHNPAAILAIKQWRPGDRIYIYHSGEGVIVGLAEVVSEPYENLKDTRRSWVAKIKFVKEFPREKRVCLKEVKESGLFDDFALVKQGRLSTMACPQKFVEWVNKKSL